MLRKYGINKNITTKAQKPKDIKVTDTPTKETTMKAPPKKKQMKINLGGNKIEKRFYCYFTLVYFLLYLFSLFTLDKNTGFTAIWNILALPILSGFLFIFITYQYHVTNRYFLLVIPIGLISYLFLFNYFSSIMPTIIGVESIISTALIFLLIFTPGALFSYPFSLLISKPDTLNSDEIKNNILIYKINEQSEEENRLLFGIVRKTLSQHLNIYHHRAIDMDNHVYITGNPFSLKHFLFSFHKDTIIFFPFLKDGYGYYISDKKVLNNSYIDIYLKKIFNIERLDEEIKINEVLGNFIDVFSKYTKPHQFISLLKSIRHLPKKMSKSDIKILLLIFVFFTSLFLILTLPGIFENVNLGSLTPIQNIVAIFGSIGGILAILSFINKTIKSFIKRKKEEKKNI